MFQNLNIFSVSGAMSSHAGQKQAVVARNIAHADTPGFKAQRLPSFAEALNTPSQGLKRTRDLHLQVSSSDQILKTHNTRGESAPNGNSVSLEEEMVQSVAAERAHRRALAIYRHGLSLMRLSLGRR